MIEEEIKIIKQIVSDINITVCENRDRINMIEQRLDILIDEKKPRDRSKVEKETKDAFDIICPNCNSDLRHIKAQISNHGNDKVKTITCNGCNHIAYKQKVR